ncbi:hypothetical protein F4778DRAFT_279057 [Xylariomycetidae sp. FL2044]|nr:hypothetical protein F4778DRAFT_279057 [Xylariomycetidae sp. FL2044]
MANSYSVQDYLLDKTNIHDTVTRLTLSFDTKDYAALSRSVYAPDVTIDYTSMFGGQPIQTTSEQWAESLEPMMAPYDSTQHVVTGLLIELPQPAKGASRPNQCTVIANVMGHLVRRSARGGPMMHKWKRGGMNLSSSVGRAWRSRERTHGELVGTRPN